MTTSEIKVHQELENHSIPSIGWYPDTYSIAAKNAASQLACVELRASGFANATREEQQGLASPTGRFVSSNPSRPDKEEQAERLLRPVWEGFVCNRGCLVFFDADARLKSRVRSYKGLADRKSTLRQDVYVEHEAAVNENESFILAACRVNQANCDEAYEQSRDWLCSLALVPVEESRIDARSVLFRIAELATPGGMRIVRVYEAAVIIASEFPAIVVLRRIDLNNRYDSFLFFCENHSARSVAAQIRDLSRPLI